MRTSVLWLVALRFCAVSVAARTPKNSDPFTLSFDKRVTWSDGHTGFDPRLPGYHVTGEIGSIKLQSRGHKLPKQFVIAIATSPGMPPMLERVRLIAGDLAVESALAKERGSEILTRPHSARPYQTFNIVPNGTYLRLQVVGKEVQVTLLPPSMQLLKQGGELSWVDWFR